MLRSRSAREILVDATHIDEIGALSVERVTERLCEARNLVLKESNRFLIAGIVFSIFYSLKIIGLRVDLVLFGFKIFDVPYGIAAFAFAANVSLSVCIARYLDARVYDRRLKAVCQKVWRNEADFAFETFPRTQSWLSPVTSYVNMLRSGGLQLLTAVLTLGIVGLLLLGIYLLPVVCALHFLVDFQQLANSTGKGLQLTAVSLAVGANILLILSVFAVTNADHD